MQRLLPAVAVPLGYALAAVALSWPLARDFATFTIGEVVFDERHAIWVLWYTLQAAAGDAAWPWTTWLHHPYGISVLVDGVGPLNALLALPYWPWGPAAAFNGAALTGTALSGWCLFALARHAGLDRGPAFFAGLLFMAWPIHLIALVGHLEKLFTGLLPLSLLAGSVAADRRRSGLALGAPALVLLGALLQNGNQFLFAVLGVAMAGLWKLSAAPRADRGPILRRLAIAAVASAVVCAPLLIAIALTMRHPWMLVSLGGQSEYYAPDLLHFVLPSWHQAIGWWLFPDPDPSANFTWRTSLPALSTTAAWYGSGLETAVTIPIVAIGLGLVAWRRARAHAAPWLAIGAAFAVLSLGPWLHVAGVGRPGLKVPLPYLALAGVPGFDVMRTPGRFMLVGSAAFAVSAAFGVAALMRRRPARANLVLVAAAVFALIECWPRPWPQSPLPAVPDFYRTLARDPGRFPVLDLPHAWHGRSQFGSAYMFYQLTHRKPIAWAYLSRYYTQFPVAGLDGLWHVEVRDAPAIRRRLIELGYRYVVWHKHAHDIFAVGRVSAGATGRPAGAGRPADSDGFIREAFQGESPVHDDELVTVYAVAAPHLAKEP